MTLTIHEHAGGRISEPGFYIMSADRYHADPCVEPSLSASIATKIVFESPLHAWWDHPRLRPEWEPEETTAAMRRGSVAHELILGKGGGYEVCEFDDWRTKAAKEARDDAIALGRTPILLSEYAAADDLATAVRNGIEAAGCADFFDPESRSELVMVWRDVDGVFCRAMIDRLTWRGVVYDVKTSGQKLDDRSLERKLADGLAVQPGIYMRGLRALWPEMAGRFRWRWVFAEQAAPHGVRVLEAGHRALALGGSQAEIAVLTWRDCLRAGADRAHWPSYPPFVSTLEPPDWALTQWADRALPSSINKPLEAAE